MVCRQNRRPKRCSTQCIKRRSVQRGGGARSSFGGRAAACWASPITPPSAASISGQRGDGHQCAGRSAPRGRCCCRREPTASRSVDAARSAPPRPSRWSPNSSRTAPESAPGSAHATNSPPAHEAHPAAGPTGHNQLATSLRLRLHRYQLSHSQTQCGRPKTLPQGHYPANLTVTFYDSQTGRGLMPDNSDYRAPRPPPKSPDLQKFGVPYGSRARMILLYLQTQALRTGSPEVELGPSLNAWMKRMNVPLGGKSRDLIREQANRLSACILTFYYHNRMG